MKVAWYISVDVSCVIMIIRTIIRGGVGGVRVRARAGGRPAGRSRSRFGDGDGDGGYFWANVGRTNVTRQAKRPEAGNKEMDHPGHAGMRREAHLAR